MTRKKYNNQKGITILELMVAMTIFVIVITLAVGGFVSLIRLQSQTQTMTDVQQNGRIAIEQMTRLARQAESLEITPSDPVKHADHKGTWNYKDQLKIVIGGTESCFWVDSGRLKKFTPCTAKTGLTLSSTDVVIKKFYFDKIAGVPARLDINITIESVNAAVGSEKDTINLNTSVLLIGLK